MVQLSGSRLTGYGAVKWFEEDWIWCSKVVRGGLDMVQLSGSR